MKYHTAILLTACSLAVAACSASKDANTTASAESTAVSTQSTVDLTQLKANNVTAQPVTFKGQQAIKVEMTDAAQKALLAGQGTGNGTSFALTDAVLENGVIEVDVAGEINGKGAPDARGFVGIAYHVPDDLKAFEAVYLRMSNGTQNKPEPPAPRNVRAVQYVAHPDFHFNVSREQFPGQYEAAAPIALSTWHKLRLEIKGTRVDAFVDGQPVLSIKDARLKNQKGKIGLWVDDGSTGYFANLKVQKY